MTQSVLRITLVALGLTAPATTLAQAPTRPTPPPQVWNLEYDRVSRSMHGEPRVTRERARLTYTVAKDSIIGSLVPLDPPGGSPKSRRVVRGVRRADSLTFQLETPRPVGFAVLLSAAESAMIWLRDVTHGLEPEVTEFVLRASGDSVAGTRTVTGGLGRERGPVTVTGRRP